MSDLSTKTDHELLLGWRQRDAKMGAELFSRHRTAVTNFFRRNVRSVADIPDPRDPENLFKSSGRGVLLIYNIMDQVEYNERGNRLTMVKRPDASLEHDLIESLTPEEKPAEKS